MHQLIRRTSRIAASALLALFGAAITPAALATPIVMDAIGTIEAEPAVLGTDPVADPGGNPVGSIFHDGGQILLEDYAGDALTTYPTNPGWWNAGGVAYTTTTAGILIEFQDLYVTGFTFNIGASVDVRAWIKAYYDVEGAEHTLDTGWFGGIGPDSTPGYGVYVNEPAQSCARITRIEVDPSFEWGIGNFGIAAGDPCVSVPEPGPGSLIVLGLLTLGVGQIARTRLGRKGAAG